MGKADDDLIQRLKNAHENSQQRIMGSNIFGEAASALEEKDAEIVRLRDIMVDAGDLIIRQQEWQTYGEQLERDADAAMAAEIQEQRKKNAALRDRITSLERQLAEETERCACIADSFTCGACGMDGKAAAAIRGGAK